MDLRYSGLMEKNYYWFFMDTHRINEWRGKQRFVECFMCGDENTVVFVPDDKIFEWYANAEPNRKGHIFLKIVPENDRLIMKIGHGHSDVDAQDYLNRFDLISPLIPQPLPRLLDPNAMPQSVFEETRRSITTDYRLKGDSLHDRVIDMVAQIGDWSGFKSIKSYTVEPGSPYIIDVVWLEGEEMALAVEVHDGGNETEAKDRLRQALRFGCRKVIVVSVPGAVARLRSVSHFESDLKNWLEIWSVARVYKMFTNGYQFFEEFRPFRKRQRSEDIAEYL